MATIKVYFDNAATTPLDPAVFKAMEPFLKNQFGNASSLHFAGRDAKNAVDQAKQKIASFLGCSAEEVYFTSGATESDNMAIWGPVEAIKRTNSNLKPHIIVSAIEHDAVLEPAKQLARDGADVTFVKPNSKGLMDVNSICKEIKDNTVLISVMYANNEIGTTQPIAEIGKEIKKINDGRKNKIYFHTDATQAAGYLDMNVKKLGVDLLSFSAHKIYGPKGVGVLYLKKNTPFRAQIFGGHQQNNVRPGTYNVAGIVGMAKAVDIIMKTQSQKKNNKLKSLRDYLVRGIKSKIDNISVNGDMEKRLHSNASIIFEGAEGESILLMLSQKGIAVSTGSACSSGSLEPSHVLSAIGVKPELAHGSIRFSLGRFNNKKEVDYLLRVLPPIILRLREMSPIK
ncbi:MAG: cysteine desulfurase family protein [Candidatus Buchananbacteria bacterium]